jgi:hypothetical protein
MKKMNKVKNGEGIKFNSKIGYSKILSQYNWTKLKTCGDFIYNDGTIKNIEVL